MGNDENKKTYTNQPENLNDEKLTETAGGKGRGLPIESWIPICKSITKLLTDIRQRQEARRKALLDEAERRRKGNFPK